MTPADNICAVVVSFHPSAEFVDTLRQVQSEVNGIVVVDNGSSESELRPVTREAAALGVEVVRNEKNLGVAAALNAGVIMAIRRGFNWVVLLDQDSAMPYGYIETMLRTYHSHPQRQKIGIVAPTYQDRVTGERAPVRMFAPDGGPIEVMTSGSMIPTIVFSKCGLFREDFFIDEVDHEYCFRVRDHKLLVVRSEEAVLLHQPGEPRKVHWGRVQVAHATNHSAKRHYYMTRNAIVLIKKYWRQYPKWACGKIRGITRSVLNVLVAEDDKGKKLCNVCRGAKDGLMGHMGQVVTLN